VKKSVIIAPLNWGLGHATRCIPLINKYLSDDWIVSIASDGESLCLLQEEFPRLTFYEIPSYNVKYAQGNLMSFAILKQLPKLKKAIRLENEWLNNHLQVNRYDLIISDNRFGFYSSACCSVFITHQLFIQVPLIQKTINKINHAYIKMFDECWVPDMEGKDNLSGKLSHGNLPVPVKYIGPLSRFVRKEIGLKYKVVAILSGPEPSRERLEKRVIDVLRNVDDALLIRGVQISNEKRMIGKLEVLDHLTQREIEEKITQSRVVLCRCGYSSIMDMVKLNKEAILIPTPGQSEQEYLAIHLKKHQQFHFIKEEYLSSSLMELLEEFDFQKIS
jgi:uncharacterized protein (TIGR00661 family)